MSNLTQTIVDRAAPPAKKPAKKPGGRPRHSQKFIWDSKCRGLGLRILDSGTKAYLLQLRSKGKMIRHTIGRHPEWTLAQAREEADKQRTAIAHGENPKAQREAAERDQKREADAPTFSDLCERFYAHSKAGDHHRAIEWTRRRIKSSCSDWMPRKAIEIKHAEVAALHDRIAIKRGPVAARNLIANLKAVFNLAIAERLPTGRKDDEIFLSNPADSVKVAKVKRREHFLTAEETERVKIELAKAGNWQISAFVLLGLLTGARKNELLKARWEDFDFTARTWKKLETKSGIPQLLPLPQAAIALLEHLPSHGTSEFVFPGRLRGHRGDVWGAWDPIRKAAKVPWCRVHDLRHSFASSLVARGVPLLTVSKLLGHSNIGITQRYAHLQLDVQREAIEGNAEALAIDLPAIETTARPA